MIKVYLEVDLSKITKIIDAIKAIRNLSGLGLKESKDIVESKTTNFYFNCVPMTEIAYENARSSMIKSGIKIRHERVTEMQSAPVAKTENQNVDMISILKAIQCANDDARYLDARIFIAMAMNLAAK